MNEFVVTINISQCLCSGKIGVFLIIPMAYPSIWVVIGITIRNYAYRL